MNDTAHRNPFDVSFSLAGEQRGVIEPIANELRRRGHSVFYYGWPEFEAELATLNLDVHLRRIYGHQTRLLVPLLSADYARKPWTGGVELTVVREFIRDRRHEAVMLLRADDAEVEGISSLHGFIHVRGRSAIEIADLIERRLGQPGQQATRPATVSNQVLLYQTGSREQWSPPATRDGGFAQLWAVANASFSADVLEGSITPGRLRAAACLVLAIGPARTTHFDEEEFDAIRAFVRDGHGLLLLGTYHGDRHHIANLTSLAKTFDIGFNSDVLLPTSADPINAGRTTNNAIDLTPAGSRRRGATPLAPRESRRRTLQELLLRDVKSVRTRDTCSLQLGEDAVDLLWSIAPNSRFVVPYIEDTPRIDHDKWATRSYEPACVAAASTRARVVVCGGWRTFSTTFLGEEKYDNQGFLTNVLQWLTVSQAT